MQTIKSTTVDVGDYTEFESLAAKLLCRQSKSLIVVSVYTDRPGPSRRRSLTS